jgi:beta-phosphoglucomutase
LSHRATLPASTIDAVIFDLNGTLVDDDHLHVRAWKQLCAEHFRAISDEEYRRDIGGRTNANILSNTAIFGDLSEQQKTHHAWRKEEYYRALCATELKEVPGATALVRSLRQQGLKLGVATNAPIENRELVLRALGIADCFDVVVGEEHVVHGKPHPEMFFKAANSMQVSPQRCVVFEDSPPGVQGAKAAGMHVIALLTSKSAQELHEAHAHIANFLQFKLL